MKKTLLFATMLASAVGIQSCKTTMISPNSMASVNFLEGNLKADKVTTTGKETTVQFTMNYPADQPFSYSSDSYLMDEAGRCYPLRSAEGIELDKHGLTMPDSGKVHFSMTFDPLPKKTKIFDYVGDGERAFGLLGIHSKKTPLDAPTLQEIASANPYKLPKEWFRSDSVTVRGRIEGYDAKTFGFKSMTCHKEDVFSSESHPVVTLDIAADGTFEKRFWVNYPIHQSFFANDRSKVGFSEIPFFARPGETIDITVRKNDAGRYECFYNSGTSKEVERFLKSRLLFLDLCRPMRDFGGKISEIGALADSTWNNLMWRVQTVARRENFTPFETQLALAEAQVDFAYAFLDYAMQRKVRSMNNGRRDGMYLDEITDTSLYNVAYYTPILQRVNYDNPLLFSCQEFWWLQNRVDGAMPVSRHRGDSIETGISSTGKVFKRSPVGQVMQGYRNEYRIIRQMMGSKQDNVLAQLSVYENMVFCAKHIWRDGESKRAAIMADTTLTEQERYDKLADEVSISSMRPHLMPTFMHPYVHEKAAIAFDEALAKGSLTTPLPDKNKAADFITDFNVKYAGQYLLFDFWGMSCAPCRAAIENGQAMRAQIAAREDITLVFIAPESVKGGSEQYREYVEKWMLDGEEVVCVTEEEFAKLQELFQFSGIPHYELITPDYRRVRADLVPEYTNIFFMDKFEQVKGMLKE